jgi:CRP-like cAMP-binding protein
MEGSILVRRFATGDIIVQADERAAALYIVHSGAVEVRGASGPPSRLGPGDMFGEAAVVLDEPYGLEAAALTETALVAVQLADLQRLCLESPDFSFRLIRHLARSQRPQEADIRDATGAQAGRLARAILELAEEEEAPTRVDGGLQDLAQAAGIPIGEAYSWIQRWLEQRVLRLADDQLTLVETEALRGIQSPS